MPSSARHMPHPSLLYGMPFAAYSARPTTLLLVEDSRHAAEAVRLLARRLGMRLRRADSLTAARQHLRVYRPDVALIDLGLPDGCGFDLIQELTAASPRLRRIVALSADPDGGPAALAAGACAFVAKPLRIPADLTALLGPYAPVLPGIEPEFTGAVGGYDASPADSRNAGADPLALRDDLLQVQAVLDRQTAPGGFDYALQFLQGVARCSGDAGLDTQIRCAVRDGNIRPLLAALASRIDPAPEL